MFFPGFSTKCPSWSVRSQHWLGKNSDVTSSRKFSGILFSSQILFSHSMLGIVGSRAWPIQPSPQLRLDKRSSCELVGQPAWRLFLWFLSHQAQWLPQLWPLICAFFLSQRPPLIVCHYPALCTLGSCPFVENLSECELTSFIFLALESWKLPISKPESKCLVHIVQFYYFWATEG